MWDLLHVITKLELGGAQLATLHEIEHSRFATGRRCLAFGPGGLLDEQAYRLRGVQALELPALGRAISPGSDLRAVLQVAATVRRLKQGRRGARLLVHTHSSKAGVVGRLGAWLGGADCIVHSVHGFGHRHHGRGLVRAALTAAERLAARVTDGFTADSLANVREGERDGLFRGRPARVVRCGVDLDAYARPARSRLAVRAAEGISPDALVVLNLACLKPQKDPLAWVEVASRVIHAEPRAVFLLAGDGELRPAVERRVAELGVGAQVRLLGWRHDVAELLHASDLFLLTSRWEGLPQAVIQAMAARLPVVATDVDGNREAVAHGESGLLLPAGAVAELAAAVLRLLGEPDRRRVMGELGAQLARPFSAARMIEDLDAFYRELTRAEPTPAA